LNPEPELETEPQPKPQKPGPRTLTPAERDHRLALLERQGIAWQRGERMTDQDCADALGISRNTWVAWKSAHRRRQGANNKPASSKRSAPAARNSAAPRTAPAARSSAAPRTAPVAPAALDTAQARQLLLDMFDRGQAAIETLERIRDLIDDVLGPKPKA